MDTPLKIVFAGTPEFAAFHLEALLESEHNIIGVYSQPDRPAGRGKKLQASPVKKLAIEHDIPVYQPQSFRTTEAQLELANLHPDIMIVVAYGLILPIEVLNTPKLGCINVHGSLLPRWRGAAPIQRSIWAGDKLAGVTIMQMDEGLDTGAMLLKQSLQIEPNDSSASLYQKLAEIGPQALLKTLSNLSEITPERQNNELATYAKKLSKEEAKIDWHLPAEQLERNTRAFFPWPMSYFTINDSNIKVHAVELIDNRKIDAQAGQIVEANKRGILVATGQHFLLLTKLQLPGKKPMPVVDILNSKSDWFTVGTVLL